MANEVAVLDETTACGFDDTGPASENWASLNASVSVTQMVASTAASL